ncbi:helix-turn-helix domain-containing protein [Glycomyces niveus]|uniref:Helix-turn-helix domain-containing protein n=1 Tax=Glycomyces niveus TaxID=2820287 RepID=A0ABS3U2R7_9ACTN|nr:helix-turn-helix transcriptional regulator [Glycomyces sp. NEAU-S30]MBO3732776.1 helix-turn-helix domain-containing protein [Glycomyces sp. NEAU-S30]
MPRPLKPLDPAKGPADWFGAELRHHRQSKGLSQSELGERVFVSGSEIGKIETAARRCPLDLARRLDQALDTGGVLERSWPLIAAESDKSVRESDSSRRSGLNVDDHPLVGEMLESQSSTGPGDSLDRRSFLATSAGLVVGAALADSTVASKSLLPTDLMTQIDQIAAACVQMANQRNIGRADLARLGAVHDLYQSIDYQYGGGLVYERLNAIADASAAMLDGSCPDRLRPTLINTVAKLRLLAGWTAFDMCDHASGQRHFAAAERLAIRAENTSLTAYVHYCQARQLQHLRHNRDAVDVLRLAQQRLDRHSTPGTKAVLEATIAPSLAALGDRTGADAALTKATDAFERMIPGDEPSWISWIDQAELAAQFGRVYRDFARQDRAFAEQAATWTRRAVDGFDEGMQRSSVLNQVGLCSAWFLAGEADAALEIGAGLLGNADRVHSARIRERIVNLGRDAQACAGRSDVDDFINEITSI